ncbi:hypothetical protein P692DRAFT_201809348 [Suillus brevipes Sb2]|nr:hypothetical protein P692DRAFT_201809348 [Suillus brevipes Sb2]
MASAAVHYILLKQWMSSPLVDPFTGLTHYNKFIEILNTLAALEGEDKAALEALKLDICEVGPSQKCTQEGEECFFGINGTYEYQHNQKFHVPDLGPILSVETKYHALYILVHRCLNILYVPEYAELGRHGWA